MQTASDIAATVVKVQNGVPIRVRDLGTVVQAPKVRLGQLGKTVRREDGRIVNDDDVVEGIVLLRKGAEADTTLDALHNKIKQLNNGELPAGVTLVPHLDRSDLVHYTTHTVLRNLTLFQNWLGDGGRNVDGVYWTIGVEVNFYVLISLAFLFGWTLFFVIGASGCGKTNDRQGS